MGPEVALAASARAWPDRLHRHLLDHGGGRVVARVMGAEQALEQHYDVLLIDDICSFLTPRLVTEVKSAGSDVIGVFSPGDGPDAKRRLLECGVSDVIETEASPTEFLRMISTTMSHRPPVEETAPEGGSPGVSIGVTGTAAGVGISELAVELAHRLSNQLGPVCLVDLDPHLPSIAQRLDLPVHPNIRTAVDRVMHQPSRIEDAIVWIGDLAVVGGVADHGHGSPLSRVEAAMLFDSLSSIARALVIDLGPIGGEVPGALRSLDVTVVVGTADPIGIARLHKTLDHVRGLSLRTSLVLVANKTPRRRFHASEVQRELARAFPELPTVTLPFDRRIAGSAWEGGFIRRGPFSRAIDRMAGVIAESVAG